MTVPRSLVALAALLSACSSSGTGPTPPPPTSVPDFVFVADTGDFAQLFVYHDSATTLISNGSGNDTDPKSAAGMLVFSSDRDGGNEIYIADEAGLTQHRVTKGAGPNVQPALSPSGDRIAYASLASGVPRLYTVPAPALTDTGYATPAPLATGADVSVPEQSPVWSPDGSKLAFTSARTGTSQVWVMPAAGGAATQVTHEVGGAFFPVWSSDGGSVIYETATGTMTIARAPIASGASTTLATDSLGVGEPTCNGQLCLAVTDPTGGSGAIVWFSLDAPTTTTLLSRTRHERQPAILIAAH